MADGRRDPLLRVADAIGALMEFWGFKRNMGRMWCVLYLHDRPLSAAELGSLLSLSAGAVSMTLRDLTRWGVVRKAWMPGERRDYFEPETEIWKMVSRVFRERELEQIQTAIATFGDARKALKSSGTDAGREEADGIAFADERIAGLEELARVGERLLSAILSGETVDSSPLALFRSDDEDENR